MVIYWAIGMNSHELAEQGTRLGEIRYEVDAPLAIFEWHHATGHKNCARNPAVSEASKVLRACFRE